MQRRELERHALRYRRVAGLRAEPDARAYGADAGQADLFRVRNRIATEIWNDMARKPYYADKEPDALSGVRGRVVELFLNKEYRGIYCLTEAMDRKEMKLKKVDKKTGDIRGCLYKAGGYGASLMWNCPSTYDNNSEVWDTFEVKYPELDDTDNGETDWSILVDAINFVATSNDGEFREHVAEYFDIPVLIDYYIFLNVLNAFDNVGKNMHWAVYDKTKDKKLTPAVWDLDGTIGQKLLDLALVVYTASHSPEFEMSINMNLINRLKKLNVDDFNNKAILRYQELRKDLLSTDKLTSRYTSYFDMIDLSGAAQREENKWSEDSDINYEKLDFDFEIYYITYWITRHLQYLDEHLFKNNGNSEITSIHTYQKDRISQPIFNLKGLKVNNPQKGIYIKDGKKYVIH